jgi:chromosome segregation protein
MFRLEKIEIAGFKSFAERTSLVFGEGITCVVGPNGCGKSNIAEAISWVLGEQSPKNLRGGKMEDVIFNGTRDRKPVGMAEVILTLVAIEDIAARDPNETPADEQHRYDEAVDKAEQAAQTARLLVEEFSEKTPAGPDDITQAESAPVTEPEQSEVHAGKHARASRASHRRRRRTIAIMAGERVTVGRRLYRTGDSEYLMNGRACLLREIQDLFAGTGLGGAHYAIIEQGRIGQILSSKPLDRRALIEEAAGITKFKSRKRATELKLESAKQNLTRLNDIISEIERQVNSLKRQAQKARRWRRLRDGMRSLQKVVFTADYYRLTEASERIARDLDEAATKQREVDRLVGEHETQHRAAAAEARAIEDLLTGLREQAAALELEADRARNRRAFDQQQTAQLNARIQEITRDQQALESRLTLLDEEVARRGADLRALEEEVALQQADLLEREAAYQAKVARLRQAEGEIEQLRQQLLGEIGATERVRHLKANIEDGLRRLDLRQSSLAAEGERAAARLEEIVADNEQVAVDADAGRARLEELNHSIAQCAGRLASIKGCASALRSRLEQVQTAYAQFKHRLVSLEDLDAHRAYYSDAVQHVLLPEQAARINALGTLADFVDVEPQYEWLVESLFGRELQCVLVPTIDDALAGVEFLKSGGLGRGAFLVVGLHGGEGDLSDYDFDLAAGEVEPPERDLATDYIPAERQLPPAFTSSFPLAEEDNASDPLASKRRFDEQERRHAARFELEVLRAVDLLGLRPEIRAVVQRAFPDKCSASVVPDMEAALHLSIENPSRVYVTYEGEQVVNGRLIITGAQADRKGTSLLALKREIRELREQVDLLSSEEQQLAYDRDQQQKRIDELESEAAGLDAEHRQQEKTVAALEPQFDSLARDLDRARQHLRVVETELDQTAQERDELESRLTQLRLELGAAEASQAALEASVAATQTALVEMRSDVESTSEQLSTARASVAARAERLQAARSETGRIESEAEELRSRINRNRLELYESHSRIDQLASSAADIERALVGFEENGARFRSEIEQAAASLASARARTDDLEGTLVELRQHAAEAHDRRGQIEVERARIQSDAEHLMRTCLSELAIPLEDVVTSVELARTAAVANEADADETVADLDPEAARTKLDEQRVKLDEMGPVNMMALEELEEAEERFKFLSLQRTDILDSIKATEEALAEIKRRSRERFRHAFFHINQNFQAMFTELFGGGRGEMILIDEDDILESGIDLIAQPPGKRLQNVLLLSGGEKAMAAIALVLAIFQYRPSPFCILDEVDAPLDEVNVGRFSDKVVQMSRDTQFLVITHNRRTMEAARALYGVTMEEQGVSKLVSVKFE